MPATEKNDATLEQVLALVQEVLHVCQNILLVIDEPEDLTDSQELENSDSESQWL